ncbi:MAG TPA: hypothetical protein VLC74_02055, partial [Rhizomicrobium sp.]|nr:hypothetical protein [Rhizomicrobium sp.]
VASAADQRALVRGDGASNPNFRAASGTPSDSSDREGRCLRLVLLLGLPLLIFPHDFICLFLPFRGDGQDQLTQEDHLVSSSSAASGALQSDGSVIRAPRKIAASPDLCESDG